MRRVSAVWTLCAAAAMAGGCGGNGGDEASTAADASKTLYVAHFKVDCVGVGPMECMQIRETPDGDWQMFYDRIEGFEYEEGYEYELKVHTEKVENPPMDASSLRWILDEVVSKTAVSSEEGAGARLLSGEWVLDSFSDELLAEADTDPSEALEVLASKGGAVSIAFMDDGRVGGSSGCNQYTGSYEIVGGHSLSFGPLAGTRKMCPPPMMELEALMLQMLNTVEGVYIRDGSKLELYGADDQLLATFDRNVK